MVRYSRDRKVARNRKTGFKEGGLHENKRSTRK